MRVGFAIGLVILSAAFSRAAGQESSLTNPTKRPYKAELVRLLTPAPGPAGTFVVKEEGKEVACQVETASGKDWVWICPDFEPGVTRHYRIERGRPQPMPPRVQLKKDGRDYLLDNGTVSVRVPAEAAGGVIPGPITSVKLGDRWVGGSAWHTALPLRQFTATVVGDGTLFAKVRLRYDFDAKAGVNGDVSAFAEVDVALGPGWSHVEISERHEMSRADYWEFDASKGWSPTRGVSKPFSGGAGSGVVGGKVEPNRELKPGGLPYQRPDLYINLFPRWNQHYKDGWFFAATDGASHVGAVVVRAGQWVWPHDNSIQCLVKDSGTHAGLRGSTWHGQRLWWLFAPTLAPADIAYVTRYAWEGLDKLNHDFLLDWPGQTKGAFAGMNFYDGGQMNPTGGLRNAGRRALTEAGKTGDLGTLARVQVMMHPDAYGSLYDHWSPENPNFFTDFNKLPIALTAQLRTHPRFEELRKAAEAKFREDMDHSITLPGGAGQECPGYVGYALKNWSEIAPLCKQYLGFDPTTWERYKAAEHFQKRIAYPDGDARRQLPMGDTHPAKDGGGPSKVDVPAAEVTAFAAEELPGFGAIFNNRPGTAKETYLAFKAGPNRGHYHGDQLALHLCFDARPVAVDHHCSYHPRAGQEHMHNRVAFGTADVPYANMDGYERLIAFKTSPTADVAVGQVESDRLRAVAKLPPEIWDQRYPQHRFAKPLVYRRTVVFMKAADAGDARDYFVIRDQFWASEPVSATYCLHALSDAIKQNGPSVDWGNLSLYCAEPAAFDFESFPWSHDNGKREATQGARLTMKAERGQFVTVLYPGKTPVMRAVPGGVRVGDDEITFAGNEPSPGDVAPCVTVKRGNAITMTLNGKEVDLDRSQGDIGLFVPDAGYPFGDIPDWLIRQRANRPGSPARRPPPGGAAK